MNRRKAVRITEEHEIRYKELAPSTIITQAINQVQRAYNLPEPHSRQAVKRWAKSEGVEFKTDRRMLKRQKTVDKKPQVDVLSNLTLDQIDEIGLRMYEKAMKTNGLEEDNWRLKNIVSAQKATIEDLLEQIASLRQREKRVEVAKQQGKVYGD